MITPRAGDRIEHWLLEGGSPFANQMRGGRVEEWDPDMEFEDDPEGRAAWDADPLSGFQQRFGTRGVDTSLYGTGALAGAQVTTVYEMIACLPSEDSDGHSTWRLLMRTKSRTKPYTTHA
jgi:hypothetical protein